MSASTSRILMKRDASKLARLSALVRGKRFLGELGELSNASIALNLEIPGIRVVILEPIAESF